MQRRGVNKHKQSIQVALLKAYPLGCFCYLQWPINSLCPNTLQVPGYIIHHMSINHILLANSKLLSWTRLMKVNSNTTMAAAEHDRASVPSRWKQGCVQGSCVMKVTRFPRGQRHFCGWSGCKVTLKTIKRTQHPVKWRTRCSCGHQKNQLAHWIFSPLMEW